jgi:diguanylate cyclase (GGDEF)-like protein
MVTVSILVLFLRNTAIKLVFVFGMIFISYLIDFWVRSHIKHSRWARYKRAITNASSLALAITNILFFQSVLQIISYDMSFYTTPIWRNVDLQLLLLFYFMYMNRDRLIIYINTAAPVIALWYYHSLYGKAFRSHWDFVLAAAAIIGLFVTATVVNQHREKWIDQWRPHLLSALSFSVAWGLIARVIFYLSFNEFLFFIVNLMLMIVLVHLINILYRKQNTGFVQIKTEANTDKLTLVGNRNAFEKAFARMIDLNRGGPNIQTFVMLDIDHFKRFNDEYGHLLGDKVLRDVARLAQETLDIVQSKGRLYRTGGEEFGILFEDQTSEAVAGIVIAICRRIYQHPIHSNNQELHISLSAGISTRKTEDYTTKHWYERVDGYLYHSKQNGRHLITVEGTPVPY